MAGFKVWLCVLVLLLPGQAVAQTYLLMVEEEGCYWCDKWDSEISHIYPKTAEGKTAPLVRHDRQEAMPDRFVLKQPVSFTPTFVLLHKGQEVGRMEGYPGEDFFWGLLTMMFDQAQITLDDTR